MLPVQRHYFYVIAVFLIVLSHHIFSVRHDATVEVKKVAKVPYRCGLPLLVNQKPALRDIVLSLFESIKHDPANPEYHSAAGQTYAADKTIWKRPLGKNVLIVDIDTRVPTHTNQIFNPETIDLQHMKVKGGGLVFNAILSHYLYALVHGYDYKSYQAQHIPDHHNTWIMPHALRELIPTIDSSSRWTPTSPSRTLTYR
jgi:hypothetical protein